MPGRFAIHWIRLYAAATYPSVATEAGRREPRLHVDYPVSVQRRAGDRCALTVRAGRVGVTELALVRGGGRATGVVTAVPRTVAGGIPMASGAAQPCGVPRGRTAAAAAVVHRIQYRFPIPPRKVVAERTGVHSVAGDVRARLEGRIEGRKGLACGDGGTARIETEDTADHVAGFAVEAAMLCGTPHSRDTTWQSMRSGRLGQRRTGRKDLAFGQQCSSGIF